MGISVYPFLYKITAPSKPKESIDKSGPPKQAPNAMTGIHISAIMMFDTKSPTELPNANTVDPKTSSLIANMTDMALRMAAISVANIDIQIFFLSYAIFKKADARLFLADMRNIEDANPHLKELSISMKSLPKAVREIVKGVQNGALQYMFVQIVESRNCRRRRGSNVGPKTLLLDNATIWLSTFASIDWLFYFRVEIEELLKQVRELDKKERCAISLEDTERSDEEWDYLKTLRDILEIYHEPTLELQVSEVSTISLTIPHVASLLEALKR